MQEATSRPYHHGDLRRAVLETAMGMLHEDKGWQFTLREVARRAGVSHAAPYKHFTDKTALLAEMALMGFDTLRQALNKAKPQRPSAFRDKYFAIARAYVRFGTSNPALYRLMFSAEADKPVDVHLHERSLAAFNILIDLMRGGQNEGALRKNDVRAQAIASWAIVHGITLLTIDGLLPGKVGPKALDAALVTLLEGLEN
jgi:AcrR family transcriptional regulator